MTSRASLEDMLQELAAVRALDFRGYKRSSLERRFRKRMQQLNIADYGRYLDYFHSHPEEIDELLNVVLINVTRFFRDPQAWEALRREAFPLVLGGVHPGTPLRFWCAGCATGEEVYSLAVLLAEHFGAELKRQDVKIYATDYDEQALKVARRAEYPAERVTLLQPEWRGRYFTEAGGLLRVNRELRRLAIFGRSNLVSDAPISRVKLLICRNVLIYFDVRLQRQVLRRFQYALEPGGVLFLGKSESQLRELGSFHPVNFRWRIFQQSPAGAIPARPTESPMETPPNHEILSTVQRSLLETMRAAAIVLDNDGKITSASEAVQKIWGIPSGNLEGRRAEDTELVARCPDLRIYLERSRNSTAADTHRFSCRIETPQGGAELDMMLRPILNGQGNRIGTLIYAEDVSSQRKLQATIEELEATSEELHSANEELETTNEELQSTNEELETTNEELQSTNEELETTNEELHSLNEELETTNDELEARTRDLEELAVRYEQTLAMLPAPVVLTNHNDEVTLFNAAAERLFGLNARGLKGLKIEQLPLETKLRRLLARRHQQVFKAQKPNLARDVSVSTAGFSGKMDVRLMPISTAGGKGVMIAFDPKVLPPAGKEKKKAAPRRAAKQSSPKRKRR